ncbi:MAG: TRZ/ATZ family hydrolase [Gammaproteobacteria bacterium]|nr:TRZ/ATZ family hydrolase [Gammaproteobacteria bacterium]
MRPIDTIINARWVIPVDPSSTVLEDHALALHDGEIIDILPIPKVDERYQPKTFLSMGEHALIPGLINAHTHAGMNLFRGLADDLPLMTWLNDHIWPAENRWVSDEFTHDSTQLAIAEMMRGGVTCFNDMFYFPETVVHTCTQSGMRACIGLIVLDFPTMYAGGVDEYISKGLDLHDRCKGRKLISTALAPHAPYTVSDEPLKRIRSYADQLDIPIHMHVHETADEIQRGIQSHGVRPIARLAKLGLISPALNAVHMTQLEDSEIEQLAAAGVHVIHCPESNLKLASGFCPAHRLMNAGINVALGTDGAASNNDLDILGEMRSAALLGKAVANDATAVPAETALRMATINGAKALGLDHRIGTLEIGKAADVVAIKLNDIESMPFYNLYSQLVYATGRDKVSDVWIAGRHVLKDRQLTTIDEHQLKQKVSEWGRRIRTTGT